MAFCDEDGVYTEPSGMGSGKSLNKTSQSFGGWDAGLSFALQAWVMSQCLGTLPLTPNSEFVGRMREVVDGYADFASNEFVQAICSQECNQMIDDLRQRLDPDANTVCSRCHLAVGQRHYKCQDEGCGAVLCAACEPGHISIRPLLYVRLDLVAPQQEDPPPWPGGPAMAYRILKHRLKDKVYVFQVYWHKQTTN